MVRTVVRFAVVTAAVSALTGTVTVAVSDLVRRALASRWDAVTATMSALTGAAAGIVPWVVAHLTWHYLGLLAVPVAVIGGIAVLRDL